MNSDETLVPGSGSAHGALERPGDQVGPYRLLRQLGEGGFGTVWLAERRQPFVQQVALKIVKAGMDSKAVVARFEQERQALAVMNHPHVAKVLDGGLTPQGRPYFAMEFVKGSPITEFCDGRRLPVKERLSLFLQVCEAVQHAHTKGIIHRDLKPSNVLVSVGEDDQPSAKVIDFGIAKAVTGRMTEQTVFTETGQMIGTPEYMSPEQADPGEADIDTRTDVYSLGVILYELLSGALPFDPKDLRSRAYREIQRVIREQDPPTPSARLSTIATKDAELATRIGETRRQQVGALATLLRSELEWIPLKAMRKDRRERYDSPADLGRDVENYLAGRPLVAAPESKVYRARKYVRRHRTGVVITGLLATVAALALAYSNWRAIETRQSIYRQSVAEYFKAIGQSDWPKQSGRVGDELLTRAGRAAAAAVDPASARGDNRLLASLADSGALLLPDASGLTLAPAPRWLEAVSPPRNAEGLSQMERELAESLMKGAPPSMRPPPGLDMPRKVPLGNAQALEQAVRSSNPFATGFGGPMASDPDKERGSRALDDLRFFQSPMFLDMQRRALALPEDVRAAILARDAGRMRACLESAGPEATDGAIALAGLLEVATIRVGKELTTPFFPEVTLELFSPWMFGAPSASEYPELLAPLVGADVSSMPTGALLWWRQRLDRLGRYADPSSGFYLDFSDLDFYVSVLPILVVAGVLALATAVATRIR